MVLKNCKLIPELSDVTYELADIVVEGDTISDILPAGSTHAEGGVDLEGRSVIPGLINLHTHLFWTTETASVDAHTKDWGTIFFEYYDFAMDHLRQGYTTIRDAGSMEFMSVYVRNAINQGRLPGPRIYTSGLAVTPTTAGNFDQRFLKEVDSADEMRKVCRDLFKGGVDYIKYIASGSFSNKGSVPRWVITTRDELYTAVETAAAQGSYVAAHCHSCDGIKLCVDTGVRTIEHGSFIDAQTIEKLKDSDSYLVLTLAPMYLMKEQSNLAEMEFAIAKSHLVDLAIPRLTAAYQAGLKLGWGTDIGRTAMNSLPGLEFIARKKYLGMSNIDMLLQATKYSAELIGIDDQVGTVAKGKKADLLVLNENPAENINIMCQPIYAIYKDGRLVSSTGEIPPFAAE